jgi:hypothetical protein
MTEGHGRGKLMAARNQRGIRCPSKTSPCDPLPSTGSRLLITIRYELNGGLVDPTPGEHYNAGKERGSFMEHKETLRDDGCVDYLDCYDNFRGV